MGKRAVWKTLVYKKPSEGGLRKIRDIPAPCLSDEHDPPKHMVLEPGGYEWTCPACKAVTYFTVPLIYF